MILLILVLVYAAATSLVALTILVPQMWRIRQFTAVTSIVLYAVSAALTMVSEFNFFTGLIALSTCYQIVNVSRLATDRHIDFKVKRLVIRSLLRLSGLFVLLTLLGFGELITISLGTVLAYSAATQAVVAVSLLVIILINIKRSRLDHVNLSLSDSELPTITVAVPARNETVDLADCLESILDSDYPKLEILVLDDCSSDKTSDVIRSFAHDGVRFIRGEQPRKNWLAKNQAYEALQQAANGQIILFCGVDVRFGRSTIRQLTTRMIAGGEAMVSVMPHRKKTNPIGYVVQPMRYWWELALPRFAMKQPASLSTCWLVDKAALLRKGGFAAVPRTVRPEAYLAKQFKYDQAYSFLRSNQQLGLESTKAWQDQFQTALRVRYPEMHMRPERVLLLTAFEVAFLLGPFAVFTAALYLDQQIIAILSFGAVVCLVAAHMLIVGLYSKRALWFALCNFPVVVLAEIAIVNESMRRYEYGVVEWKGRNICSPALTAIPRLPVIKD